MQVMKLKAFYGNYRLRSRRHVSTSLSGLFQIYQGYIIIDKLLKKQPAFHHLSKKALKSDIKQQTLFEGAQTCRLWYKPKSLISFYNKQNIGCNKAGALIWMT